MFSLTNTITAWIIDSDVLEHPGAPPLRPILVFLKFVKPGLAQAAGLVACPEAYAKKATTKRPGGMAWLDFLQFYEASRDANA